MNSIQTLKEYCVLLNEVRERIQASQHDALKTVNKELINLYWDIGKKILEWQTKYCWGRSVVLNLAKDLQNEFPGMIDLSAQNLLYMRQFFLEYNWNKKLRPLVGEVSWANHLAIINRCKFDLFIESSEKKQIHKSVTTTITRS